VREKAVYEAFAIWLGKYQGRPVFVSDNPAFDWQWINDGFGVIYLTHPNGGSAEDPIQDSGSGCDRPEPTTTSDQRTADEIERGALAPKHPFAKPQKGSTP
jgi:hypothetical protein